MKILDKYIIKRLLMIFIFLVIAATASIEMIHFVNYMEAFKAADLSSKEILLYYLSYTPYMLNFLTPIVAFMSTVLVTLVLAGNSEIIAAFSIGIKFRRLMIPYIIFAFLIAMTSFVFCGWFIPFANNHRVIFEINYLTRRSYSNLKNIHLKVDTNKYVYVQTYNAFRGEGYNFTLESFDGELRRKLFAEKINWIPSKGVWRAKNWNLRKIDQLKESLKSGTEIDLTLNLEPSDFGGDITIKEMVNMSQLGRYIKKLQERKSDSLYIFKVEKYTRYMYPFSIFILVLVGMLFASRKMRAGAIWQTVLSFILAIIYLGMFMFASSRAESHKDYLLLTLWMPNIIFSVIVGLIYRFVPK
ncbi:MAG: YjgP/YjgQ family permease [Bacteroidetes bacterium]|nr:YjgP/YjgQ family permease [Bacteroidota bacterium]